MPITAYAPISNIWFYLLVAGIIIALATYIWQFRETSGAIAQVCVQLTKAAWLCFSVLLSTSSTLSDKLFWFELQYMATCLSPYLWFIFTIKISKQENELPSILKYMVHGSAAVLYAFMLTDSWHHLLWQRAFLEGEVLRLVPGACQKAIWLVLSAFMVITVSLNFRWIFITNGMRRKQAWWYTLVGLFTVSGALLRRIPSIQWISPFPLFFLLASLAVAWGFYRWRVYNISLLAEETVVKNMIDGLVVVDEYGCIVEVNPMAQTICTGLPLAVGERFSRLIAAWPALSEAGNQPNVLDIEVMRQLSGETRYYRVQVTPLSVNNHLLGKTVVLQDITQQKRSQAALIEQQRAAAVIQERANLARELHDDLYQVLGYVNVQSHTIMKLVADGKMDKAVADLNRLVDISQKAYTDMQEYIRGVQVVKLAEKGLAEALETYAEWVREAYDIKVELAIKADIERMQIEPVAAFQLMRIVQEALNNVRKHAKARSVRLVLTMDEAFVQIRIADDGGGYQLIDENKGFGLTSMRERAEKVGGKLTITSAVGQGAEVVVEVPRMAG
ncbi:histidine kinase N-terminal 7TM domain-containing protein [uncultured Anaeromusa sp.]|uniref:sensor histidine kinase n=1 Tax=uncultured Anaeromusa sp. TaxID=673273 RepID=UPI0029C8B678|nr:histidine kinase N-terminal 7TM domain-containing protein [uncultured Anaeromusa sp.]